MSVNVLIRQTKNAAKTRLIKPIAIASNTKSTNYQKGAALCYPYLCDPPGVLLGGVIGCELCGYMLVA